VILNTIPVLSVKYFFTIDGATHYYNANLIKNLVLGNSPLITSFFKFNTVVPPNWTGHAILAILGLVFNAFLTEKIFILLFVILLPVSFRYAVRAISNSQRTLTYLIFPFTYTFLFEAGFFNFCISFIFMFLTLGYWFRYVAKFNIKRAFIFCLLLTLTFFSHILIFGMLEMLIAFLIIGISFRNSDNFKVIFSKLIKKLGVLFLVSIPSLILMMNFLVKISLPSSHQKYPLHRLIDFFTGVKSLVLFNWDVESKTTHHFAFVYLAILLFSFLFRIKRTKENQSIGEGFLSSLKKNLLLSDLILVFSFFILLLYFLVPDGTSAGMISDRLLMLFFILLITWLAIQKLPKWVSYFLIILTLGLNLQIIQLHISGYKDLSNYADRIAKAAPNIRDESIVYSINFSEHWMLGHLTDYLGVDNRIVFTNNFEANLKWFPLVAKGGKVPQTVFDNENFIKELRWKTNSGLTMIHKIDYIFIFGNQDRINESQFKGLKEGLKRNYSLIYCSNDHFCVLYALKVRNDKVNAGMNEKKL